MTDMLDWEVTRKGMTRKPYRPLIVMKTSFHAGGRLIVNIGTIEGFSDSEHPIRVRLSAISAFVLTAGEFMEVAEAVRVALSEINVFRIQNKADLAQPERVEG